MKTLKLLHRLRGAWCVLTSASLILGGVGTASAFTAAERAEAYAAWMNTFFYTNSSGEPVFRDQEGGNASTSFWQGAEMIEVVEDAVVAGVETTTHVTQLCNSFITDNSTNWSWNTYNDDIMWACRAFNRAYQLTGNTSYLIYAQYNWDTAFDRGWCFSCGGGLYQDTGAGASFCTCGNAPGADAAFMLYTNLNGITSTNTYYLGRAQLMYGWMVANVWNTAGNGGVEEGPGNPGVYFSYDQGTFSEIAFWLGDTAKVQAVGNFTENEWGTSWQSFGTGSDAGIFNTIGIRGLALTGYNTAFLQASAERGWGYRNNQNLGSVNFGGQTPNGTDLYAADASDLPEALLCAPVQMANGTYNVVNLNSALDMTDPATNNGTLLDQNANNAGTNQQWTVTYLGNGIYKIIGVQSGDSLDVVGSGTANGTGIDAYTYNSTYLNQQWSITPTGGGYCRLTPENAIASCVDVQSSATTNGAPLVLWTSNLTNSPNSQQWEFVPAVLPNGIYDIVNRNSGLLGEVKNASTTNSSPVDENTNSGGANQQWAVTYLGGGIYQILGVQSGLSLDVYGSGTANGTEIDIYPYHSTYLNQQWSLTPTSGGYYRLTPGNATGSCLDTQSTTNGTPLDLWTYGGGYGQQWEFVPAVTNGIYNIVNLNSGELVDVERASTTNGSPVDQYTANGGTNQQWAVTNAGGGIYQIIGVQSGLSLDVVGSGTANGTPIDIYTYHSTYLNQQWTLTPSGGYLNSGGYYYRLTPGNATGSCLDAQSPFNGTPLDIWTYIGGDENQQWSFQVP